MAADSQHELSRNASALTPKTQRSIHVSAKAEPANIIRPARVRRRTMPERGASAQLEMIPAAPGSDSYAVQQRLGDRFVQDGDSFYFRDGRHAFRDHGRKLSTNSETSDLVATLIEVARSRDWQEIEVQGAEGFRREVWRQASAVRLSVRGYKPTAVEHLEMVRLRGVVEHTEVPVEPAAAVDARGTGGTQEAAESFLTRPGTAECQPNDELTLGTLLAHGLDSFRFEPRGELSYFIRLDTAGGRRTFWDRDLQRAIARSATQPKIGDEVALWDRAGKSDPSDPEAGRWWVERRAFFEARAGAARILSDLNVAPQEGVRRCPDLVGAYLTLRAAELSSAQFGPESQKRFAQAVRERLADSIARGDPYPKMRLRQRSEGQPDLARNPPGFNR
jgi:Large polyvalent protein-associated domain 7